MWHVFYKASMQMELFSIQKIVIINSVHDREFELRNDEYLCTKKNLFRKHNGLKHFLRKNSFFCLVGPELDPIQKPGVSN